MFEEHDGQDSWERWGLMLVGLVAGATIGVGIVYGILATTGWQP